MDRERGAVVGSLPAARVARADAPSEEGAATDTSAPPLPHYLATWSAGVPLRLSKDEKFDQGTLAPVYTDLLAGYVFAGHGTLRHGAALGFSLNLTEDGGFTEPVRMYDQFVVMPAYVMMFDFAPELFSFAHAGLPINLHAGTTVGARARVRARLSAAVGIRRVRRDERRHVRRHRLVVSSAARDRGRCLHRLRGAAVSETAAQSVAGCAPVSA